MSLSRKTSCHSIRSGALNVRVKRQEQDGEKEKLEASGEPEWKVGKCNNEMIPSTARQIDLRDVQGDYWIGLGR